MRDEKETWIGNDLNENNAFLMHSLRTILFDIYVKREEIKSELSVGSFDFHMQEFQEQWFKIFDKDLLRKLVRHSIKAHMDAYFNVDLPYPMIEGYLTECMISLDRIFQKEAYNANNEIASGRN